MGILDACELSYFEPETARVFENAIERLFYSDSFRIGKAVLPQSRVRSRPHLLDGMILRTVDRQTMCCAAVVPYRVRIVIPASEMWEDGQERPGFVLQNMVGAMMDFIVIRVDGESGFAVASRRMAARSQRYDAEKRQLCGKILSKW